MQYWNGSQWSNISAQRTYGRFYEEGSSSGYSHSDEYEFAAVTGSKVRYGFDNCDTNILGTPNVHGWLYEFEIFNTTGLGPVPTAQPASQTVSPGGTARFSMRATGPCLTFQWQFNGTDLPGATNATLTLPNADFAAAGAYRVVVRNPNGVTTSQTATLSFLGLRMYAGLTLAGPVGARYRVDFTPALGSPANWLTLTNVVLPHSPYSFVDWESGDTQKRFYRAVLEE